MASVILCQGCYLGHSRVGKTIAYATNGTIAAGGIALIVTAHVTGPPSSSCTPDPDTGLCFGPVQFDLRPQIQELGVIALGLAVVGLVIDLAADASPPVPRQPAPPATTPPAGGV
jgi:hypothetical protein